MRILTVAGARPNFMKVAPLLREFRSAGFETLIVHTGQHYDAAMSDTFFRELRIPDPDFHLEVGSGSHATQTARIMERFEPLLLDVKPDWLVVVGDVNSTLACALVAAKLKEATGCRIAHVEAGLRSGDWAMPEEVNRVLTDRLSDLLLIPSEDARANLVAEGIDPGRIAFVGNVMIDTLMDQLGDARANPLTLALGLTPREYVLATLHRPSNVDDPERLAVLLAGLTRLSTRWPVILPMHPRTRQKVESFGLEHLLARIRVVDPLGYRDMLSLTDSAAVVLTDSGGLQEETTALGVPCVTLRDQTERPVTVLEGTNRLAPHPLTPDRMARCALLAAEESGRSGSPRRPRGWDGHAAARVVAALVNVSTFQHPQALVTATL